MPSSDTLGFEVRNDVGYDGMRWITFGPADQPGTSIVLEPPVVPACGVTEDERRTIVEMMAKGTYAGINLATADLDGTFARVRASAPRSSRSPPTSRTVSRLRLPRSRGQPDPHPGAGLNAIDRPPGGRRRSCAGVEGGRRAP